MKKIIVLIAALAMVLGFTASAMADASVYGSARFVTFWHDTDKEYSATDNYDDQDLEWQMGKLSRFGVNFQQGDITGKFEVDARAGQLGSMDTENGSGSSLHGNIRLRQLWGEWNFGAGKLGIGHTDSLYTFYITQFGNNAGAGMAQFGGWNLAYFRTSQIRLTFGNLKIAFLTPDTTFEAAGFANVDKDTTIPRIEVAYQLKLEPVTLDFMGGYQTYDLVDATDNEESIDSYVLAFKAAANFGPGYVKGIVTYRQNGDNYGVWNQNSMEAAVYSGGEMNDAHCYSFGIAVGYKVSDMITVEGAYVYSEADSDRDGNWEDPNLAYGILCKITPAPGVTIQPEFMIDDKDDITQNGVTTEEGDDIRIGVFWKIDFK